VTSDPKRLTVVGATDLERTLLQAARGERPSPEMTKRMAAGLGISVGAAVTAAAAPVAAAPVVAANSALGGWIAAGVLAAAAVAAGVVGVRTSSAPAKPAVHAKAAAPAIAAPAVVTPPAETPVVTARETRIERIEKVRRHPAAAPAAVPAPASDLRDQIALLDAARTAVKAGSSERALVLLRRYDASYPAGAFRPEALALRIEALSQDGRRAEAQALAREFLTRYPQSPVADRVARVAGK
jgi:hypothetical protein